MIYTVTPQQRESLLSSDPEVFQAAFLSLLADLRRTFDEQGVVLVRGLLDQDLLQRLCHEAQIVTDGNKSGNTFTSLKFGPIFSFPEVEESNEPGVTGKPFRETAMASAIPAFVGRVLLRMEEEGNGNSKDSTLRLLKDAFMAKGKEQSFCGWHVDDSGFWPTSAESTGVNVWIALDDMPSKYEGGLAISPGSHQADWREEAYRAIGSVKTFPPEGLEVGSKFFQQVVGRTCSMATLDPPLNDKIEASRMVFDYQRGDCLFCTRWLFHRSMPINEAGLKHYADENIDPALKRYSIRYELGSAKVIRGMSVEACVLLDPETSGRSLDEVCQKEPFYPKCWPQTTDLAEQESQMKTLAVEQFPKVEAKREAVMQEVRSSYLKKE